MKRPKLCSDCAAKLAEFETAANTANPPSEAKKAAARENGKKGGRPRKNPKQEGETKP